MLLRARRELVCQQMVELVTDYLEGCLSRQDRKRFERHLAGCPNCTAYLEQIRSTIRATGTIAPEDLSPGARDELTALYRAWRADAPPGSDPTDRPA